MADLARQRGDRTKNLVGFAVGGVRYAVDILKVREILNPLPLVELPHAPSVVVGVADHRGEVVPIVDLRRRFGLASAPATRRTKWIIVQSPQRAVGLIVDEVTDVFGAGAAEKREVPRLGEGDAARGIGAVFVHQSHMVFVIDVEVVVSVAEQIDIPQVVGTAS